MTSTTEHVPGADPGLLAGLVRFNSLSPDAAAAALRDVCASAAWTGALLAGRPYAGVRHLRAASDAALAALSEADLAEAMAGHPPIGRPTPSDAVSAREQRGMTGAPAELRRRCSN